MVNIHRKDKIALGLFGILFVLILIAIVKTRESGTGKDHESSQQIVTEDVEEEEATPLDTIEWEKLSKCKEDEAFDWQDGNDFLYVFKVTFGFEKICILFQTRSFDRSVSNLRLKFALDDDKSSEYVLPYVFPGTDYEILIERKQSMSMQLVEASWDDTQVSLSESKEFGFPIWLKGVSTLKYFSHKSIVIRDKYGCIINELDLDGHGTIVLNQGAAYYQEVIKQ